jgi:hypothetical protein
MPQTQQTRAMLVLIRNRNTGKMMKAVSRQAMAVEENLVESVLHPNHPIFTRQVMHTDRK